MLEVMRDYWALVAGAVGGLTWLVRLESRGIANEKEIKRLWEQRREDLHKAETSRKEMLDTLKEMRADIKKLLERH